MEAGGHLNLERGWRRADGEGTHPAHRTWSLDCRRPIPVSEGDRGGASGHEHTNRGSTPCPPGLHFRLFQFHRAASISPKNKTRRECSELLLFGVPFSGIRRLEFSPQVRDDG